MKIKHSYKETKAQRQERVSSNGNRWREQVVSSKKVYKRKPKYKERWS